MTIIDEKLVEAVAKAIQGWEGEQPSRCAGECYYDADWREYIPKARAAITAYEAAKPVAEPVAWFTSDYPSGPNATTSKVVAQHWESKGWLVRPLSAPASKDGG